MSSPERDDDDDHQVLRIADAIHLIDKKVNIIGVVSEASIPKKSKGTDYYCTLKIIDKSHPSGISVNFFAESPKNLPHAESPGDIIQLSRVVIKKYSLGVNAVSLKSCSSFALYDGKYGSEIVPYQVWYHLHTREQHKKIIAYLREWAIDQPQLDSLSVSEMKQGQQCNLICQVIHVSKVTEDEWMLFVWDGTDAPPVKIEEELENPIPLQIEASSLLSREMLLTFPRVGTVLRMTGGSCNEKLNLHLLKGGTWVKFWSINVEVRFGIWCGVLLPKTRIITLGNDDKHVQRCQRKYDERMKDKWGRMPATCFPWPSHVTDVDVDLEDAPFFTLMDVLTYPHVTAKYKCVVRVLETLPGHPQDFRAPCGTYRVRLTLEDPTARLDAYVYAEDGVKFFGEDPDPLMMIERHNALLGVEETDEKKVRDPPWVQCCIKSYYLDENDKWGTRKYRIFGTTLNDASLL